MKSPFDVVKEALNQKKIKITKKLVAACTEMELRAIHDNIELSPYMASLLRMVKSHGAPIRKCNARRRG